ncbi:NAD(P)-binding protein [Auriculariales sp. MPI-PUGE-AT-0066]|nr:NAD(P)-binding protein [Auriculariales sp. MPI-PUGE-AT-0066]KAH7103591.1 NAD(P)-binding protein [Auriculariales sp. MPI-PUGE-AT-0066]
MASFNPAGFHALTPGNEVVAAYSERVAARTFLVTGASPTSIGCTTATFLAGAKPAAIILVARSASKLAETTAAVTAIDSNVYVLPVVIDLSSMASVRQGAETILSDARISSIDVVINNAAIMAGPYEKSPDGIELQFATCHIGHFLLTLLLAPKLRASAEGGRVVNVSSSGHRKVNFTGVADYDPLFEYKSYEQWDGYGNAKLANILFTKGLVARGFQSYSLHPGSVYSSLGTRINNDFESATKAFHNVPDMEDFQPFKTLQEGPNTQLVAALRPASEIPNGSYYFQCQIGEPSALARDESGELTKKLWDISEKVVGQKFD